MDCVLDKSILTVQLPDDWAEKTIPILRKYSDRKLDLADTSLIVLADCLDLGDILSVDIKDFTISRWKNNTRSFNNLMKM